jgi:hypothetical protein
MKKPIIVTVLGLIGLLLAAANPASIYRDLALNPNDVHEAGHGYPHASSNSETRNEPCYWAINAIKGYKDNLHHGPQYPSWGPEKRTDLWWRVDFGRAVAVDKVVLLIRADFPHDGWWHAATLVFSDGSRIRIEIKKTAELQVYEFPGRKTAWVMITDLVQDEPLQWCALTAVEVWGRE